MSTWNKFCFTGGYVETSVVLPGVNNIVGLWPAVWTMGNLGRAGYGASLDGMVSNPLSPNLTRTMAYYKPYASGRILMTLATSGL